jgi:hypothetical protein
MPLKSVQKYVKNLLDGIAVPGQLLPLEVHITPPALESVDGPIAYVWGSHLNVTRQTMPRGAGFQNWPWMIDIWVVYLTNENENPTIDDEFPDILDTIMRVLRTTTMPVFIDNDGIPQDVSAPVTSRQGLTQIQRVGERWTLDYPPERTPATMRMYWYSASISVEVLEVVQG